jgi:septal ring factor EnvC (AmiA/AmiB activator)
MSTDTTVLVFIILALSNLALWISTIVNHFWCTDVDTELDMIGTSVNSLDKQDERVIKRVREIEDDNTKMRERIHETEEAYKSLRERFNVEQLKNIRK